MSDCFYIKCTNVGVCFFPFRFSLVLSVCGGGGGRPMSHVVKQTKMHFSSYCMSHLSLLPTIIYRLLGTGH